MEQLPESYRLVLLLKYTNELSYEEIADITDMSPAQPIPNDEDRLWEQHLFREEPDADFTLEVMRKLEGVSMESAEDGDPFTKKASKSHWMRPSNTTVGWSFQFNIDMTKAKLMAVEAPMNNTYTTPEGLKLDMTQLVRTPNGTRLDMNVSLDDQLRAKVGEDWAEDMDIMYHIEIPETNEYRIFNESRPNARQAKFRLRDMSRLSENNDGEMKLSETWDPAYVTVDAKKIRFVLDGYTIPVWEEKSVEVDLEKMRKDAEIYTYVLQFKQYGDEILFSDFNYKPIRKEKSILFK
ncbi:hypothetical protein G195_001849 [Phytophthora kernoviae 00238/432]|uniref:RNA polymerase sigma factor 70 region 4 type 2 domain-containing protein n=1 Tax=Phytophthora kernoviae 00238/432 TaxID=1284355 RepID=A0A8J4SQZ0_9STRA|nr:hypothetical protein G195_001849 [Phytophthora kernoviae 00238/432]